MWDLSIKPKMLEDSCMIEDRLVPEQYEFSSGQCVSGYVYKVDGDWAWLTISRHLKAKLFVLDSACEPSELQEFQKRFYVGKAVTGHVLNYNKEKASLRLVLHPFAASQTLVDGGAPIMDDLQSNDPWDNVTAHIRKGAVVGGRISKILPGVGGLLVQLGPHIHGRVHFTELQESLVPDPLSAYKEGQFVKSKVLEISHPVKGTIHIDLSLHLSLNGTLHQNSAEFSNNQDAPSKRVDKIEDLQRGMVVQGYVKNVSAKGCFISLSRKLDAKILISNLSDGFIDDPVKEFPIGKLVTGRVLSVEHLSKRIEVTLKSSTSNGSKSENSDLSHLHVGEIISGRIKRVESYGLFIAIDHTNLVGLCHMSQLLDDPIGNIESKYRAGEKVTAKILKVDEERRRISLGMKNLDVQDEMDSSKEESDEEMSENDSNDGSNAQVKIFSESSLLGIHNIDVECQNERSILAQAESRTSIPPLEVTLDDMEHSHPIDVLFQNQGHLDEADTMVNKKKQEKKKPKKLSEQEITAAEDRRLEGDEPRTADEFEMVIRGSPNNSFLWIAYMRFMLSLADIEKARSIAERALNTINFREEDEKLNIWVAYFNLENEYGNPPEDAVKKVFQRALQYCDPKKVHLALLKMYTKTNQNKLAEELLDKMAKKFKHSCKFWLKRSMATSLSLPNFLSFFLPSNPPPKTAVPPPQLSFSTPQAQKYESLLVSQESAGGHGGSLSTELSSVVCPSLAFSNTLFFKSAYNVQVIVEDNEPEERLLNRFRREVMRAGVIQECKRRRFHENKQEEKKRKTREAHKRNRRSRRPQMRGPFQNRQEAAPSKKNDDDDDNWEMPEGDASF